MSGRVERVSETLARRGLRLVTAESCTGGLVAARLTDRPGSSRFFHAGLISYSNAAKEQLLGVSSRTLVDYGAVSEEAARAMVKGALRDADVALAVTGIAGPGGGTTEKPVGTVWIAAGLGDTMKVRRHHFEGGRIAVREASVDAAFDLLERVLEETE